MPPIPGFLQKAAVKRALALLMLAVENWDRIKPLLHPVFDRGLRILIAHADSQGSMTATEGSRLKALAADRPKGRGGDPGQHGWTFEERLEVVLLLQKAYRENRQAQWVLAKVRERLDSLLRTTTPAEREGFVDSVAVEDGSASVTISRDEYERLRHLAGEADR